jgi:hypothetical protein
MENIFIDLPASSLSWWSLVLVSSFASFRECGLRFGKKMNDVDSVVSMLTSENRGPAINGDGGMWFLSNSA